MLLTLIPFQSFSQTSSAWLDSIDVSSFKVYRHKGKVPAEFFSAIGIENKNNIANAHGFFRKGCTGFGKGKRLNWVAKDKNGHFIICMSHGGRSYGTEYYYCELEKGKPFVYGLFKITKDPISFKKIMDTKN